jgi:hypothetical protein
MFTNKRGMVSIPAFSFAILLLILTFIFTYNYYIDYKEEISIKEKKLETLYAVGSFRTELLKATQQENATIKYTSNIDPQDIKIILKNSTITGQIIKNNYKTQTKLSTLGPQFCNNYTISTKADITINYDGNCIQITTS